MATENEFEVNTTAESGHSNVVNIEAPPMQESTTIVISPPAELPPTIITTTTVEIPATTAIAETIEEAAAEEEKAAAEETIAVAAAALSDATDVKITETKLNLNANLQANGENNGNAAAIIAAAGTDAQHQQQQTQTESIKGKMDSDPALANFKVLYVLTQLCGLTMIVLVGSWLGVHMGGFAGTSEPTLEFNWHPLLMTIGMIFLYGNSILVYRGFRTTRKKTLKISHASIHMITFVLTVIALQTVFDSHNLAPEPVPNMYSLHSWLGLGSVLMFCIQYACGFMAYMVPGLKQHYKIAYMPLHIYFGLFGFVLAVCSALMGLTEKAIFSIGGYKDMSSSGVLANICGLMYVVFAALVLYLATEPAYKRKPLSEDTVLMTGVNE